MGDRYGGSIWEIDMGDRYGRSDINKISIGISKRDIGYRYGIRYIDMVIYHIDMVILDIDMEYGLMIWEMTVSIRSSSISIWDIWSLWHVLNTPLPSGDQAQVRIIVHRPPARLHPLY